MMIHHAKLISLVPVFVFCQIIGSMCGLSDLSIANDRPQLAEDMNHMSCPMDGTIMCPPSAASSPERQLKQAAVIDLDQAPVLASTVAILSTVPIPIPTPWSRSNVFSIVPVSIASSSVLRI